MSICFRQFLSLQLGPAPWGWGRAEETLSTNKEHQTLTGAPGPPCGPAAPGGPASPLRPGGPLSPFPPGSPFWPCREMILLHHHSKKQMMLWQEMLSRSSSEGNLNIKLSVNAVKPYCPTSAGGEGQSHVALCVPEYSKSSVDTYWGSREASRPRKTLLSSFTLWKTTCQQGKMLGR